MEIAKEVLDALALTEGETVLAHWKYEHYTCVLTNHRIAVISPPHVLDHPHHEVNWSRALESIQEFEVQLKGGVDAPSATQIPPEVPPRRGSQARWERCPVDP